MDESDGPAAWRAYAGCFRGNPRDLLVVAAQSVQDAFYWADAVGEPATETIQPLRSPLVIRLQAKWEQADEEGDGFAVFAPHPNGAVAFAGRNLVRPLNLQEGAFSDDMTRSYGTFCKKCLSLHFPNQACRRYLEDGDEGLGLFVGYVDGDTGNAFVAAAESWEEAQRLGHHAGRDPVVIGELEAGTLLNLRVEQDGVRSDPEFALHDAVGTEALARLAVLLRPQAA